MTFEEFEAEALRVWEEIPANFKEGIDGIVIRREHLLQEEFEDYYTLGTCSTEPYPSDYRGPETSRSILNLYYGSFLRVAEGDPDFPWEEEIWETVTHELRHHLEHLAEDDETDELDYAMEGSYRRGEGLDFDPWYFQAGVPIREGIYRVERDVYIEVRWRPGKDGAPRSMGGGGWISEVGDERRSAGSRVAGRPEASASLSSGAEVCFDWDGWRWAVPWPEEPGDIHFLQALDLETGGGVLDLVLVKEPGIGDTLKRYIFRTPPVVFESESTPRRVAEVSDSAGPEAHGWASG